jgi:tRNA(Ile)-lysidine synthase TilS/MesJ
MVYELFKKTIKENKLIQENYKIIVLHSLGKDASVLVDMLCRYKTEVDFELLPILFRVPNHAYRNKYEVESILQYWEAKGINIDIVDFDEKDTLWEEREVSPDNLPCNECRNLRNKQIDIAINQYQPNIVAAGFNLTDLQNYLVTMMFISNFTFDVNKINNKITVKRFISLIPRFFINVQSGYRNSLQWILPLIIFEDKFINEYLDKNNIPYLKTKCNFKNERARNVFCNYMNKLHLNYSFDSDYNNLIDFLRKNFEGDLTHFISDCWINEKN